MGTRPGSYCLVAVELDYVVKNGGIGTANWILAHLLARHGWRVHILYVCPVPNRDALSDARRRLAAAGIGLTYIDELPPPPAFQVRDRIDLFHLHLSERVRHALEELHRRHDFELIEFAEAIGAGCRTLQARQASGALAGVGLLVKLHSMSQWLREGNRSWLTKGDELLIDYLERQSFALADFQVSPSRHLLDYACRIGWTVRPDAAVVRYPLPLAGQQASASSLGGIALAEHEDALCPATPSALPCSGSLLNGPMELVFFGRLEVRKGLDLFLDALELLDPSMPVTFLGRDTLLDDGRLATQHIDRRLAGRPAAILTNRNREEALAYLTTGHRLAVLPSLMENYANAVLECVVHGIPFVASAVGGTPEIVPPDLHGALLFQPTAEDLARCVQAYLSAGPERLAGWRRRLAELHDPERHNAAVLECYERFLEAARARRSLPAIPASPARVTVALTVQSLQGCVPDVLQSLAEQTWRNLDVVVLIEALDSTQLGQLEDLERRWPRFRFLRQPDRDVVLAEAGEFFLPLDGESVLRPVALERLVLALRRNPGWSAVTAYSLSFRRPGDVARGKFDGADRPPGGPLVLGSISNVFGEAPALCRTADLRASEPAASNWLRCVRLACAGRTVGVLPEHLFYRHSNPNPAGDYALQMQVIEEYARCHSLPADERFALWTALVSFHQQRTDCLRELFTDNLPLRYKLADRLNAAVKQAPWLHGVGRSLLELASRGVSGWRAEER